jgi:hypothetical protein
MVISGHGFARCSLVRVQPKGFLKSAPLGKFRGHCYCHSFTPNHATDDVALQRGMS